MLIRNATIVDVRTGELISPGHIQIEKGKIIALHKGQLSESLANDLNVIDASGKYIIPGLIDCHVHMVWDGSDDPNSKMANLDDELIAIIMTKHCEETLRLGITTIRDAGSPGKVGFAAREAIRRGIVAGPNLLISGPPIVMTGGHVHTLGVEADGPDEVRKAARQLLKEGVDFLKLMASGGVYTEGEEPGSPQLTVEEMKVAVQEAHKKGKKVAAHAEGIAGIFNALKAGVDTIEHGNLLSEQAMDIMIEQETYLIPTLMVFKRLAEAISGSNTPGYAIRKAQLIHTEHFKNFKKAVEKGVKIAAGTDGNSPRLPESMYFDELQVMHELGMSKLAVLQAATIYAADALGLDDVGSLEPGKQADLLLISVNPIEDLDIRDKITMVIKDGKKVR